MSKVVLVTGASSGMGKMSAKDLIQAGYKVYCVSRSIDKMESRFSSNYLF